MKMKLMLRTALVAGFLAGMSLPALANEHVSPMGTMAVASAAQTVSVNHGKCSGKCGKGKCGKGSKSGSNSKSKSSS